MNMKRISKQLLVGLSLGIGILPIMTKINHSALKKKPPTPLSLYDLCGEWLSPDENTLFIDNEARVFFNLEQIHLIQISGQANTLALQDKFGYFITIEKTTEDTLIYYDEAEDVSITFMRKRSS